MFTVFIKKSQNNELKRNLKNLIQTMFTFKFLTMHRQLIKGHTKDLKQRMNLFVKGSDLILFNGL